MELKTHSVAVIGAGPAGIFAARELAKNGVQVLLFNRDIKPGGLAEYGIYPDKFKMKAGLRNQFENSINMKEISYFGNILIGTNGLLSLSDLRKFGVDAICITTGAQGTKWLGLPVVVAWVLIVPWPWQGPGLDTWCWLIMISLKSLI